MDSSVASQLIVNMVSAASIYMLVGVGFGLVLQAGRFFHMAHGAVLVTAPYTTMAVLTIDFNHFSVALVCGVLAGVVLGVLLELGIYKPLRRRGGSSLALLIASLGGLVCWQNVLAMMFGDDIRTLRQGAVTKGIPIIFGARLTGVQLMAIGCGIVISSALAILLRYTRLGQLIRAVADDPELAFFKGIRTNQVLLIVMVLASAIGGVGALLVAYDTGFTPQVGFDLLLTAVVVAVVGGVGSIRGMAVAALLVAALRELCGWYIDTSWRPAVSFLLLITFLLLKPRGISGLAQSRGGG